MDPSTLDKLTWEGAQDPDGDPITQYHVQVSPDPEMRYPLSPNFDRITSSGEPAWPVPQGWFVRGRTYYWRVRARDGRGAWSPWSACWAFTAGE